jgi:mannose-6-phosphate isomerase-like protein (cupin superfamily)
MAITVTTPAGATIPGVGVEIVGASDRSGTTNESGQINFTGMQAGSYRVRFSGDEVIAFEREVTLRANQVLDVDVTLYPAPPPKVVTVQAEPEPAPAAEDAQGPAGEPQLLSIVDLLDKEFIGRAPRRETLLSCSGSLRTTMVQLNDPQPDRLYEDSDATYYVLAGEGTIRIDGREAALRTNGYVSVPRGVTHSFVRKGGRPFVLLATLSGEACEEPR